jgi:sarcosine oxidase subunit beta
VHAHGDVALGPGSLDTRYVPEDVPYCRSISCAGWRMTAGARRDLAAAALFGNEGQMSTDNGAEIIIVGGGIYGASLAYDLAKAGRRVTLLEAREIAAGASGGPGERGVRAANRDMRELPIVALAQQRWAALQAEIPGGVGYRRIGGFQVYDFLYGQRRGEVVAEMEARVLAQEALGIPTRLIGRDEVLAMEPELSPSIQGAIFCPDDGVGDHGFATRQLSAAAAKAGAIVRTDAKVVDIICAKARATAVKLADGETIPVGHHLVLLANVGVPSLLRPMLRRHEVLPVWTIVPQMLFVTNPENRKINHLLGHKFRRLAVKQLVDGTVMISGGQSVEPSEGGLRGTLSATALNVSDAIATFPFLDRSEFLKVDGSRTDSCAIDHIPIIGKVEAADNLIFGFAWSGHGFAISLGFARYLVDWIICYCPDNSSVTVPSRSRPPRRRRSTWRLLWSSRIQSSAAAQLPAAPDPPRNATRAGRRCCMRGPTHPKLRRKRMAGRPARQGCLTNSHH